MQRLIFLRLIIAYGFNFPSILDLFKIVSGKFKSVFGSSTE